MIGSFLTKTLALVLGYAYPAYECFKTVELNKPEIEQLRFWCQYWILVAALTVFERVGESFISWLPMYSEAKVLFFVYLWYPKTRGTAYVYETFFRPYVAKHETEIDRNLLELRTRAGDMVVMYSQRIASYGQTRFYEILQFVASQSQSQSSRPHPAQPRQQPQQARPTVPITATRQPAASQPPQQLPRAPPSPLRPTKSQLHEPTKAGPPSAVGTLSSAAQPQTSGNATSQPSSLDAAVASTSSPTEAEAMQVDVANVTSSDASSKDLNPPPQETPMEESIRVTRGRLRRRAATGGA